MRRMKLGVVIALGMLLALPVFAQPRPGPGPKIKESLAAADTNQDGKVTFEEMKAVRPQLTEERFKKLDRNGDGALTKEDMPPEGAPRTPGVGPRPGVPWFIGLGKQADANQDGKVTLDELKAAAPQAVEKHFAKLDRNGDGVLTPDDAPPGGPPWLMPLGKEADANGDGKVTLDELKAAAPQAAERHFAKLDRNADGVLSRDDVPPGFGWGGGPGRFMAIAKEADKNNDGKVTFEELKAVAPQFTEEKFKTLDHNADGVLSKDDAPFGAGPGAFCPFQGQPGAGPGGPGFWGRGRGPQGGRLGQRLRQGDANADGKVTYEEAKTMLPNMQEEQFKALDRNGDGVLSDEDRGPRRR